MEILKKISWTIIDKYHDDGLLLVKKHPTKSLWILNYTQKVQFESLWDNITMSCRGIIVDSSGNIVARTFIKFFNVSEHENYDFLESVPNDSSFQTFEKLDGSLGILFNYKGEWIFASRGSFESEQAIVGKEILDKLGNIAHDDATKSSLWDKLSKDNTYIFEIIYHQNKIVVDYGDRKDVVLLGVINTKNGNELPYGEMKIKYQEVLSIVSRYDVFGDIDKLKEVQEDNKEGFVILFNNGLRVKLKFDLYIKLHQVMSNTSSKDIWRCLRDNISLDEIIKDIPDEMFQWIKKWEKTIKKEYNIIEELNIEIFNEIMEEFKLKNIVPTKKDFALANFSKKKGNPSIRFKMFENKSYNYIIWKIIEPTYKKMSFY